MLTLCLELNTALCPDLLSGAMSRYKDLDDLNQSLGFHCLGCGTATPDRPMDRAKPADCMSPVPPLLTPGRPELGSRQRKTPRML